jgi:hypothetical protein
LAPTALHPRRVVLRALAAGADVAASYRTPRAQRLVRETAARAAHKPGTEGEEDAPVVCGELTALHAASRTGTLVLVEFLLQVGLAGGLAGLAPCALLAAGCCGAEEPGVRT